MFLCEPFELQVVSLAPTTWRYNTATFPCWIWESQLSQGGITPKLDGLKRLFEEETGNFPVYSCTLEMSWSSIRKNMEESWHILTIFLAIEPGNDSVNLLVWLVLGCSCRTVEPGSTPSTTPRPFTNGYGDRLSVPSHHQGRCCGGNQVVGMARIGRSLVVPRQYTEVIGGEYECIPWHLRISYPFSHSNIYYIQIWPLGAIAHVQIHSHMRPAPKPQGCPKVGSTPASSPQSWSPGSLLEASWKAEGLRVWGAEGNKKNWVLETNVIQNGEFSVVPSGELT